MKNPILLLLLTLFGIARSQNNMLALFKTLPAFPVNAKEAFKVSKTDYFNSNYSYKDCSEPITAYVNKVMAEQKPYLDIVTARANKTNSAATGAANDFSDLNSPEVQAKLAKMSQEEKMKFAMEIQARMANSKNVQSINQTNRPSPLNGLAGQIGEAYKELIMSMPSYTRAPFPGYSKCEGICPTESDKNCAAKMTACESKISHNYFGSESARYTIFISGALSKFNEKKVNFENKLKEFDSQAAKYPKEEIAPDCSSVLGWIASFGQMMKDYEKQGSDIIIDAKNNGYCRNEY